MTGAGSTRRDALVLAFPRTRFVALATDVVSFDTLGEAGSASPGNVLGEDLQVEEPAFGGAVRQLTVRCGEGTVLYRTRAQVRLLRLGEEAFWKLPAVFAGRCAPWISGLALLEPASEEAEPELALWVDLQRLGVGRTDR